MSERVADTGLSLTPGTQALLPASSMGSPIGTLPVEADDPLLVVSSQSSADVAAELSAAGAELRNVGHVPISGAEAEYDGPMWVTDPVVPDDLTGLSMRLSRAFASLGDRDAWLLVENLNVFLMYASHTRVCRFFDHLTASAAGNGITGIYTLAADAVEDDIYDRLRVSVDTELGGDYSNN